MNELMKDVFGDPVFAICALFGVVGALTVVVRRNPVYCALGLMLSFLSFAVIFIKLNAPFLAAMHVLVYTGAILVLFLFVIMLLNLSERERGTEHKPVVKAGVAVLAATLCGLIVFALLRDKSVGSDIKPIVEHSMTVGDKPTTIEPNEWGGVTHAGEAIFKVWAFPFELVSLLVVVAILGAVVLAKRKLPPEI